MNEDYYYDNDTINSTAQVEASSDYYSAKPFTRTEYWKSADMAKQRKSFLYLGIALLAILVLDFLRIWYVNGEYDIESYVKMYIVLAVCIVIGELVNQKLVNAIICFLELFCGIIITYGGFKTFMFLIIPGMVNMVLLAVHFEQCLTYERKWRLYKDVNYKE